MDLNGLNGQLDFLWELADCVEQRNRYSTAITVVMDCSPVSDVTSVADVIVEGVEAISA